MDKNDWREYGSPEFFEQRPYRVQQSPRWMWYGFWVLWALIILSALLYEAAK